MFKNLRNIFNKREEKKSQGSIMLNSSSESWQNLFSDGYVRFDQHPDVKICTKIISDLISSMTIYLMKNTNVGNIRETNGLSRILDIEPNKTLTRQKLIKTIVEEFLVYGNSILLPKYTKTYKKVDMVEELLESLDYIPQEKITYIEQNDNTYKIKVNNTLINYDEIIHFTYNQNFKKPYLGMGMKSYLKDIVKSLKNAENIKNDYYTNQYKPNIIFSFNADTADFTSEEMRTILYDKWLKTKPGEPYMLPAQLIESKSFPAMALRDIAVNENVEIDKKSIAKMFGIPSFMIGLDNFNEDEYNNFIDTTISPIAKGMAQELTKKLILSSKYYIKFNLDSLKAFKTEEKIDMMLKAKAQGVFSANEIRIASGYDPINEDSMNEFNILENYIPISKLGDQKKLIQE